MTIKSNMDTVKYIANLESINRQLLETLKAIEKWCDRVYPFEPVWYVKMKQAIAEGEQDA